MENRFRSQGNGEKRCFTCEMTFVPSRNEVNHFPRVNRTCPAPATTDRSAVSTTLAVAREVGPTRLRQEVQTSPFLCSKQQTEREKHP